MNQYSWTKLANVLFVDQPVGTGFSGGGDAANTNAEVTEDFYLWLVNFFSLFPGLKSKRIHLMGESYAGIYIPYFADFILKNSRNSTINLKSISLGDGTIGNVAAITDVVVNKFMHEQNHFLKVPNEILNEFDRADKLCGFDTVLAQLQYPPAGKIIIPGNPEGENFRKRQLVNSSICEGYIPPLTPELVRQEIDAKCYDGSTGCATFTTATDYLRATRPCWNIYNVATDCSNGLDQVSGANWLNKPSVKSAIQAPLNKTFEYCNATVQSKLAFELVRPPVYDILPSLLSLMPVHIYSGQYDLILNHIGTELAIQNMTWRGHQGFKRAPLTPFYANGIRAGTWGRERGLSYHLFERSGHMVPRDAPASAFVFVRDFVLKSTGLQGVN
ncbi:MAG: hypothetical protein M1829_002850 [Trizodia sp. TS-e1964]|nr:MAG: hypothetical protein M1829_002850 [Trizodia sp. TS-e1964]